MLRETRRIGKYRVWRERRGVTWGSGDGGEREGSAVVRVLGADGKDNGDGGEGGKRVGR